MVKADCLNPSHGGLWLWLTGEKGTDARVRCCKVIRPVGAELPPEPTHREWENDCTGYFGHLFVNKEGKRDARTYHDRLYN
jgi:hypothetical protein